MFSEENIERTKERLVEYVKDNAYSFRRKYDKGKGQYGGHWSFTTEELSAKPIEDAIEVLGTAAAVDIIAETLNEIYDVSGVAWYQWYQSKLKDPVGLSIAQLDSKGAFNKPFADKSNLKDFLDDDEDEYDYRGDNLLGNAEYEWFNQVDIKTNDETESIVKLNVESESEDKNENEEVSDNEMVNHPPHYNQGKFETIDIIEDIVAGYDDPVEAYLVGATIKYLSRANFKGAKKQDLEKAEFYLKRAIDRQQ